MLQTNRASQELPRPWIDNSGGDLDLAAIGAIVRRQIKAILACSLLGLILGIVYILLAEPLFTASSSILINTRATRAIEGTSGPTILGADKNDNYIENQAEVIKSESIALFVVDDLKLLDDPQFLELDFIPFVTQKVKALIANLSGDDEPDRESVSARKMRVVARLLTNLEVRRVASTSVLDIRYTWSDPTAAARIANAYANAYLADQFGVRTETSSRARSWLERRIGEVSVRSLEADAAIQRFRAENSLVSIGGRLITDQQLSELNTQLTLARAETSRMVARYTRIQAALASERTDMLLGAALEDPVINNLRTKFLDASKREAEVSSRVGAEHSQAISLREEMRQYEKLLLGELNRIGNGYRSDFEVAKSREQSLRDSLAGIVAINTRENDAAPKLRELEREADTLRTTHKELLQRLQEATQLESFPIAEARVITYASAPLGPSYPRKPFVLVISLMTGMMFGVAVGTLRELTDRSLRTGRQIRTELGVEFLGNLPAIRPLPGRPSDQRPHSTAAGECHPPPLMRYAARAPLSRYSETLRSVKVAVDFFDQSGSGKVIGITSGLPNEGKSTTAMNLASLLALQGRKTLLIDADLRNRGLSRAISPDAELGLLEAISLDLPPEHTFLREPETGLSFLPSVIRGSVCDTSDILASTRMSEFLSWARRHFDYIVLDLPPLGPVVDVKAAISLFSTLLVVVEWGKTPSNVLVETVLRNKMISDSCVGIVFNKVDQRKFAVYDPLRVSSNDPQASYKKYYHEV